MIFVPPAIVNVGLMRARERAVHLSYLVPESCVLNFVSLSGTFCPEDPASSPVVLSSSSWLTVKQASLQKKKRVCALKSIEDKTKKSHLIEN